MVLIREASIPHEIPLVRTLFEEYAAALSIDLCFQGFTEELSGLPGKYARPSGGIWLATIHDAIAGCIALRPLDAEAAEIKRLYVRPEFRGSGAGRALAEQVLMVAREAGYRRVRLDTLSTMTGAIALYRLLGFTEVEPYYDNPIKDALFFGRELKD